MTPPVFALHDEALAARLSERLAAVEDKLRDVVAASDGLIESASRHLANAGGKRLRPLLTLLTSELGPNPAEPGVVDAATVVELTHLASLYHDDVMDDAPVRRGAPAVHEVWGNSVAILAGDLLFAKASKLAAGLGDEVLVLQADTFVRLCTGQLHETVGPRGDDPVAHYLSVLADKTAALIATSARFGAMLAGCPARVVTTVGEFGEKIGVAFQLADDVIDLTSDGSLTGKTPGTDLREGVPTMPVLLLRSRCALPGASAADRELLALLDGDLSSDAALAAAVAALREHPVVEETRVLAAEHARDAVAELDVLPDGPVKLALVEFADALVDRSA